MDSPAASALSHRLRAATHLLAVLSTTPLLLSYILRQYLSPKASAGVLATPPARQRTVLVTGGKMAKSLFVARALWRAGHRVVLVETEQYWCSGSRLSRAVWAFATVADPRKSGAAYLADLQRVFEQYGCDTFMPVSSPFSARYDAMFLRGKQPQEMQVLNDKDENDGSGVSSSSTDEDSTIQRSTDKESTVTREKKECVRDCRNLHFAASVCDILDDKHSFWKYCTETLGLPSSSSQDSDGGMLPSHRFISDEEVLVLNKQLQEAGTKDKYVLKNLGYDPLHRLDLFCLPADGVKVTKYLEKIRADGNGVSEHEPWQAQLFIDKGVEMSCFAVLRDSSLELFTCALSSASQLRYVHAGRTPEGTTTPAKRNAGHVPLIDAQAAACRKWVDAFCAALREKDERLDGQLCWDFMCTNDGAVRAFPLECNPRVHSQCAVFGAANGDQRRFGEALVGSARDAVLVPDMATDAEAETHFWGWWANEFYSRQDTSLLLRLLEMLHSFVSGVCFLLGLSHGGNARVFRYTQACDENATWYTSHFSFKDSDFDAEDPLPFLGRNLLQPLVLFWGVLLSGNEWTKYDFCIGKVVQKNGD
eukprot:CAMPEP_0172300578 /NCGR_PEP_ID=MMETSP1058-20130122/2635_1 /TAXON_ID=83371 /ORGANISM="Detonula confervacea, Strain CCMP 353" /LENGTH=590 /DNA_ID=CAMNT_0013010399 /DNA_START=299 /DNA_END=2071 /DNA_ORIENTATION=+